MEEIKRKNVFRGIINDVLNTVPKVDIIDERCLGKEIDVSFKGELRENQEIAIKPFRESETGVLSATTAFGKTVIGSKLIAEKRVNTLVLVHRTSLLTQWKERLEEFLELNEEPFKEYTPKGRLRKKDKIGIIGSGKIKRS